VCRAEGQTRRDHHAPLTELVREQREKNDSEPATTRPRGVYPTDLSEVARDRHERAEGYVEVGGVIRHTSDSEEEEYTDEITTAVAEEPDVGAFADMPSEEDLEVRDARIALALHRAFPFSTRGTYNCVSIVGWFGGWIEDTQRRNRVYKIALDMKEGATRND
jgi:hypothetical protein